MASLSPAHYTLKDGVGIRDLAPKGIYLSHPEFEGFEGVLQPG
jgi:hypothetical protein